MSLIGYHGTCKESADSICLNGFRYNQSPEHWLGNGVYFFLEKNLAVWWSKKPSKKFGTDGEVPTVIEAIIDNSLDVCDLRDLDDFNFVKQEFEAFWKKFYETASESTEFFELAKMQCAFFDWLQDQYSLKMLIGVFLKNDEAYQTNISDLESEKFSYMTFKYPEVQVCVYDKNAILSLKQGGD